MVGWISCFSYGVHPQHLIQMDTVLIWANSSIFVIFTTNTYTNFYVDSKYDTFVSGMIHKITEIRVHA